jgi:hypothetical protein
MNLPDDIKKDLKAAFNLYLFFAILIATAISAGWFYKRGQRSILLKIAREKRDAYYRRKAQSLEETSKPWRPHHGWNVKPPVNQSKRCPADPKRVWTSPTSPSSSDSGTPYHKTNN